MLKIEHISVSYGAVRALDDVSLHVEKDEIVALIGNNGAGKSTTQKTIMNLVQQTSGTITFNGIDISDMPTNKIVKAGMTLCPEGRRIFAPLTVRENLEMGAYLHHKDKKRFEEN